MPSSISANVPQPGFQPGARLVAGLRPARRNSRVNRNITEAFTNNGVAATLVARGPLEQQFHTAAAETRTLTEDRERVTAVPYNACCAVRPCCAHAACGRSLSPTDAPQAAASILTALSSAGLS